MSAARTRGPAKERVATGAAPGFRYATELSPPNVFYSRVRRGVIYAFALVAVTLGVGIIGYHELEDVSWLDAFHQSALLLSGMGPVIELKSSAGKVFDGVYALFCGIILLAATGFLFAPVLHRILHRFHIEDSRDR